MFWVIIYNNRFVNGGFVMKKKSFITMGAATVAVAGILAGCGGSAGTETTTAKDITIESVEEVTA